MFKKQLKKKKVGAKKLVKRKKLARGRGSQQQATKSVSNKAAQHQMIQTSVAFIKPAAGSKTYRIWCTFFR